MAYAIVESGGKQYVARTGETIDVDRLSKKAGDKITFESVLLVAGDGAAQVGTPHVEGAQVLGHVLEEFKGPKIVVFKYKPKIRYRKRQGHRQWYTRVAIDDVVVPGQAKKSSKKAEGGPASTAAKSESTAKAKPKPKAEAAAKKAAEKAPKASSSSKKASTPKKPAAGAKKSSSSSKKASSSDKDKKAK